MKTQVIVDKKSGCIICTAFSNGKKHDFMLFKESKTHVNPKIEIIVDTGYTGIDNYHKKSSFPKKKSKKHPLSKEDKSFNRLVSRERVLNENVISFIKRFKIVSDKYRNRRKRFKLRFNLICGICNFDR